MADPVSTRYREALQHGHTAVVKGRPREAVQHYEEAGRLAEDRPLPFVSMGRVYLQMRKPKEAGRAFDEALRRAPGDIDAMRGLADALAADGRVPDAEAMARRAAELEAMQRASQPAPPPSQAVSAGLEQHVEEARRARAAGRFDVAVNELLNAARGYAAQGRLDAALDACTRALQIWPGAMDVHLLMADLYLRRGWRELATERVRLIEARLGIDDDPVRRGNLVAMARAHRDLDPELERLAGTNP